MSTKVEAVNSPPHYTKGGIECIEAIRASMSDEQFKGYLKGNILKYLWRYQHKGKVVEDLLKSQWYLSRLLEVEQEEPLELRTDAQSSYSTVR